MIIRTLDDLRQADDRTLQFTPMGLGVGVRMRPAEAAEYQQEVVAQFNIHPRVTEGTRDSFERLRTIFAYGVLCYELYTLVHDRALLVFEQALRDRFVDFHEGEVTFVDNEDAPHVVEVSRYAQVQEFLRSSHSRPHRSGRKRGWRLRLPDGRVTPISSGMLGDLRKWARNVGLLRGQRNRAVELALSKLRNDAAHPSSHQVTSPVWAAGTIRDLAEIINQLWGIPTPGGRLYPAPLRREVIAMAWRADGNIQIMLANALADFAQPGGPDDDLWECVILRAVHGSGVVGSADPNLHYFDSRAEITHYPTDLVWGPGTVADATDWFTRHGPKPDQCDYLDRIFMTRYDGPDLYLPLRPAVAATLPDQDCEGTWYTIKADHPNDAYLHARNLVAGTGCNRSGPCNNCPAENIGCGPHDALLAQAGVDQDSARALPENVRTPWALPRSQRVG